MAPTVVIDDASFDDEPLYRELDLIARLLSENGVPAKRVGERVEIGIAEDVKARLNFTEYNDEDPNHVSVKAELEVFVLPEPCIGVCFCAVGRGPSRPETLGDYLEVFAGCLIPPLQTMLCPGAADGVRCKHFVVGQERWRALPGPAWLYTTGEEDEHLFNVLSDFTYGSALWELLEPALTDKLNGASGYSRYVLLYAANVQDNPVVEARFSNELWPEGMEALKHLPWPQLDQTVAFREFWLIDPENDECDA